MSIDDVTTQLRGQLQEAFGMDGATYLMDRPPGGWKDLVTNESLDRRLADFGARMDARFETVDVRLDALSETMDARFKAVDARLGELKHELSSSISELARQTERDSKVQTWRLMGTMFSVMTLLVALATIIQKT